MYFTIYNMIIMFILICILKDGTSFSLRCTTSNVQGYVKNVTPKGCFIILSRRIDARILFSNLSDGYIETPEKEFPIGLLVHGRYLSLVIFRNPGVQGNLLSSCD